MLLIIWPNYNFTNLDFPKIRGFPLLNHHLGFLVMWGRYKLTWILPLNHLLPGSFPLNTPGLHPEPISEVILETWFWYLSNKNWVKFHPSDSISKPVLKSTRIIQTPIEEVFEPLFTSPEVRLLGVPNTDPHQVFGGFGMSRVQSFFGGDHWSLRHSQRLSIVNLGWINQRLLSMNWWLPLLIS